MALKFKNSSVRLWQGISKDQGSHNIGIRFKEGFNKTEIKRIHTTIKAILILKYGKGVE